MRNRFLYVSMLIVLLASALILLGWEVRPKVFVYRTPNYLGCNPVTAISFLLLAMVLLHMRSSSKWVIWSAACTVLLMIISIAKLSEMLLHYPFFVDQWLFRDVLGGTTYSAPTAICFLLMGSAVVAFTQDGRGAKRLMPVFLIPVVLIALFSFFGFLLKDELVTQTRPFAFMSLITSGLILLMQPMLWSLVPDQVILRTIRSPRLGGTIARQLIVLLCGLVILTFVIRHGLESQHWITRDWATSAQLTILCAAFFAVIIRLTGTINHADDQLQDQVRILQDQSRQLQASHELMQQFISGASHDLQEPLRKIIVFSEMIERRAGPGKEDTLPPYLFKITATAHRMSDTLKGLLSFVQINRLATVAPVDLNAILRGVLMDQELMIEEQQAVVQIGDLPTIPGVAAQLHQLFYNLVGNALKFHRSGVTPHITVTVHPCPGDTNGHTMVDITVADNGIGFAQQYAEQIFDAFQRLNSKKAFSGSGLGLSFCKRVAEGHGGKIYAESEVNGGTRFHVCLPS